MQKKKGISLIVLVITIIIMIILAGSVIISLNNTGIIEKAHQAAESTSKQSQSYQETITNIIPETLVSQITAENYGDKIEYSANDINDWRIFYNDGKNVYIITTDYLPSAKIPSNLSLRNTGTEYSTVFWYISTDFPETAVFNTELISKYKTDEYSKFLNTNNNIRAASILLNTENWEPFTNKYAVDAIGSPTIGMWVASWNEKYPDDKILYKINAETDATGYLVGVTEDSMAVLIDKATMQAKTGWKDVEEENNLYYPHKEYLTDSYGFECTGYWLASPSANGANFLMRINCDGRVYYAHGGDIARYSLRPVVCLRGDVGGTFSDGKWNIK